MPVQRSLNEQGSGRRGAPAAWQDVAMATAHLHLTFPAHLISQPVMHQLGTGFELVTNIRRANIEERGGWIIVEVRGEQDRIEAAIAWLVEQGLQVDRIEV
jgi:ABC-type methionine transport system ATPase subunit